LADLVDILLKLGGKLGFEVATEVEASKGAWIDVVWFDSRFKSGSLDLSKPSKTRRYPVLPVVGFEIEGSVDSKQIKGSVTNLDVLSPIMGIIVLRRSNLDIVRKKTEKYRHKSDDELWKLIVNKVYRWVYAEAQPKTRIVIMTENEVLKWAEKADVNL